MAKIVITIEDLPNGKVKVTSNPTCEQMVKMMASGNNLQASHGYAFAALNTIREESRRLSSRLIIPKVLR